MPLKGLAALAAYKKEQDEKRAAADSRVKVDYFKFEKGVNTATVRFLQEFDEAADNYDERFGLAVVEVEHEAPGKEGFKSRATCTKETEGFCYACDRKRADYVKDSPQGNWKTKANLYIKALASFNGEEPKLVVVNRGYNTSFAQALVQEAIDENTVTDGNYRITRVGEGTEVQWLLKKLKGDPFEVPDKLENDFSIEENVLRSIKYDDQPTWYGKVWKGREQDVTVEVDGAMGMAIEERPQESNEW